MTKIIALIGDSLTEGFEAEVLLSGYSVKNFGVSGDSTLECYSRIKPEYFSLDHDFIFICIGTNDLARDRSPITIANNLEMIVEKCAEKIAVEKIVILSLFPTRDNEPRPLEKIIETNKFFKEVAKKKSTKFLDLYEKFTDEEGKLKAEYTEDGLHFSHSAYLKWADEIKKFVDKN